MKRTMVVAVLLVGVLSVAAGDIRSGNGYVVPSDTRCDAIRRRFEALERPLAVEYRIDVPSRSLTLNDAKTHFDVAGAARLLVDQVSLPELVYALWPYLDVEKYDAEVYVLLSWGLKERVVGDLRWTYRSSAEQGNWPRLRRQRLELCKRACCDALGQPYYWYPHQVLFDRDAVLAESKTNAAVRASYVAAMVKALADPKIRTENPLEVKNMLGLLYELNAVDASPTFCDYLFFDWRKGQNHRIGNDNHIDEGSYPDSALAAVACLARLGESTVPYVLERLSRATPEERSVKAGGGGAPVLAIRYFYLLHFSEENAIKEIHDFKLANRNLSEARIATLDEIAEAIRGKKYRPRFFSSNHSEWAATGATNALPASQR